MEPESEPAPTPDDIGRLMKETMPVIQLFCNEINREELTLDQLHSFHTYFQQAADLAQVTYMKLPEPPPTAVTVAFHAWYRRLHQFRQVLSYHITYTSIIRSSLDTPYRKSFWRNIDRETFLVFVRETQNLLDKESAYYQTCPSYVLMWSPAIKRMHIAWRVWMERWIAMVRRLNPDRCRDQIRRSLRVL
jgi:hypothetical protein